MNRRGGERKDAREKMLQHRYYLINFTYIFREFEIMSEYDFRNVHRQHNPTKMGGLEINCI